ncbi:MAG: universal stress protein [Vicinamibacteraceae bacterium]
MENFSTIVAAVDFSETSCDVLEAALVMARATGGRVRLLHVVPQVAQSAWSIEASELNIDDLQREWTADAETQLAELANSAKSKAWLDSASVVVGPAAAEIVRYAEEHAADAIVVGSHGRGVIRRLLIGTVTERVLREASCPVLVVPDRALRGGAAVRSMRVGRTVHAA